MPGFSCRACHPVKHRATHTKAASRILRCAGIQGVQRNRPPPSDKIADSDSMSITDRAPAWNCQGPIACHRGLVRQWQPGGTFIVRGWLPDRRRNRQFDDTPLTFRHLSRTMHISIRRILAVQSGKSHSFSETASPAGRKWHALRPTISYNPRLSVRRRSGG